MKRIVATLALGASLPVMASGVYVGGQAGWASFKSEYDATPSVDYKENRFIGGLYAGYEHKVDGLFFAAEADINFGDAENKRGTSTYTRGNFYGLSGLIGMPVNQDFDVYGRVGWVRTEFSREDSSDSFKKSSTENGYSFGLGGRYHLDQRMAVRAEYRYNGYRKFQFSGDSVDNKNKDHVITVGLQYMF